MALPASGSISFSQISNEFGLPSGRNLGAYRISQNVGSLDNLPLDTEIPQSESIAFSNFRGKRLNIVVDFHSIENDTTRRNARNRYNNNHVTVIGGFRTRPVSSSGTKVYINVNRRIGSDKGGRNNVALRTGSWDSDTQLITVIGSSGSLMGAGGNGGRGGGIPGAAGQGTQGSSALGIEHPTTIINKGVIFGGRGGGGGGAGGYGKVFKDTQDGCEGVRRESLRIGGGGGAGGRGLPGGTGGEANTQKGEFGGTTNTTCEPFAYATNGTDGSKDSNGSAGQGGVSGAQKKLRQGQCKGCGVFAFSGGGGAFESGGGSGNYGQEGQGGQRGYSIIISSSGSVESFSGNPELGARGNGTIS